MSSIAFLHDPIKLNTPGKVHCFSEDEDAGAMVIGGHGGVYYAGTPETEYESWGVVLRVKPGALDDAIREDDVRCFFNHDENWLLGRNRAGTMSLGLDAQGATYRTTLDPEDPQSKSVYSKVRSGNCDGSSMYFQIADANEAVEDGKLIQWITRVKPLFEMGPVVFPAMRAADSMAFSEETAAKIREVHERNEREAKRLAFRAKIRRAVAIGGGPV
jgi:HK97 family phage prohead protease